MACKTVMNAEFYCNIVKVMYVGTQCSSVGIVWGFCVTD